MTERLKKVLVSPKCSIKQALKQMDAMGEKTLIVVDDRKKIAGTITDGDIRRWILKGKGLGESLEKAMNCRPLVLKEGFSREGAKDLMIQRQVECLPVVDGTRRVVASISWVDLFEAKPKNHKSLKLPVVVMAGGEGVRLHPFTKVLPKPLMPIGDKPIIEIIIDRFFDYGCDDFYLSLNYKSNMIKAYFSDFEHKYKINYILESKPLGTAGSLHLLKNRIKKTFFVSNCDILIEADYTDILRFHNEKKNKITLVSSMKNFTIPYGVCDIGIGGALRDIREKPEYDFLVNTGMYLLDASVLGDIPKNRFYNITDLIGDYIEKKEKIGVYPVSEKSWLDMGQFEALQEMLKKFEA
ncbi:MAG: nucleotidyltransferase family protein [Candidatus Omnitrophica bacterium]|nr:nucleotidyltransferase family protein [Candidatus Omnitrophota bacterium]MDD5310554.1 nucleotidyltransferase family protein [Candidatus Omnitrophota bacterium]MDD5546020.1 nucleotidyltransferase family protein [Candidatus Omnitrophota bacterium]